MILSCQSPLKPQLAPENSAILSLWGAQWLLRLCLGPAEGEAFSSVSHSTKTLFPSQHRAHRDPSPHWGGALSLKREFLGAALSTWLLAGHTHSAATLLQDPHPASEATSVPQ